MALRLEQKQALVAEVSEVAQSSHSAVAAEYRGLTVHQMTELRSQARASGVYLKVVKNTLAKRAIEGSDFACMEESLRGPILLAFSREEPGAAARLVKKFSKDNEELVAVSVAIGGQMYPAGDLDRVASLPTREEALATLAGLLKAPIEKFVRTLAEPQAKLVRTVAAVRDQKEAA